MLLQILITSLAIEKCKKDWQYSLNYSGTRFLSTSKITQLPDGFCINVGLFEPVFFFFFFWKYFMENLLNLPKCKLLHVTEPKKIKFLVL